MELRSPQEGGKFYSNLDHVTRRQDIPEPPHKPVNPPPTPTDPCDSADPPPTCTEPPIHPTPPPWPPAEPDEECDEDPSLPWCDEEVQTKAGQGGYKAVKRDMRRSEDAAADDSHDWDRRGTNWDGSPDDSQEWDRRDSLHHAKHIRKEDGSNWDGRSVGGHFSGEATDPDWPRRRSVVSKLSERKSDRTRPEKCSWDCSG